MLTRDAAMARLRGMTAASTDPVLTDAELEMLLTYAAAADGVGRFPTDDGWEPTYSEVFLNRSAAEGWMMKVGKLTADKTHSDAQGNSWSPEQRRRDMMEIANDYRRRIAGSQQMRYPGASEVSGVLLN